MNEKPNPSFQKARDEALRALISHGGLRPDQVSGLKLDQVHLATGTLVVEPDEFDPSPAARDESFRLQLDATMQRALIAWLVVRPDGPNDHLFPGTGLAGLDVSTINQVIAAAKSAESRQVADLADTTTPPRAERRPAAKTLPESPPPRTRQVKDEAPPPVPPAAKQEAEPEAVSLDEIESLRQRLAEAYDAWSPAVPLPRDRPLAASTRRAEVPPSPPAEVEPWADMIEPEVALEPEAPPSVGDQPEPIETPLPLPEEISIASPAPTPDEELDAAVLPAPTGSVTEKLIGRLRGLWRTGEEKVTLNLTYRVLAIGGMALLMVACCIGLGAAGGAMLSSGGLAGLLAGRPGQSEDATPAETQAPTEISPSATFTPSPSPTPTLTAIPSPTTTPSLTLAAMPPATDTPAPTSTVGPTPTPIIIVVTATPTPEPPPTATSVPTNTPVGGVPVEPTATSAPSFKYPAPALLEPKDGATVPGVINILKWESVGPLADGEWYAVRLMFLEQGQPVYEGDRVRVPEWRVPDRLYYRADGPALRYRWFVFVERDNPDGSTTQLSPESETLAFRWE